MAFQFPLRRTCLAALFTASLAGIASAQSPTPTFDVITGDLKNYLGNINVLVAGGNDYVPPTGQELNDWRAAVQAVLTGDLVAAAEEAAKVNYEIVYYRDNVRDTQHVILREGDTDPGYRGVYAICLNPEMNVNMQSPHPLFDGTRVHGIDLYVETKSVAFMQAGTHRNNSSTESPCDGLMGGEPYRISDMAHVVDSFFQIAHEEIFAHYDGSVAYNIHGMSADRPHDVIISNGTTSERATSQSLSRQLAERIAEIFDATPGDDRTSVSHQEPAASYPLSGTTNKQGRHANGSPNPCNQSVSQAPIPERFIHIEQKATVRSGDASNWAPIIEALQDTMPAFPAVGPFAPAPAPAVIASWPLDGDGTEIIASRDATLTDVALGSPRPNGSDPTLDFNGTSSRVSLPAFDLSGDHEAFSLSFWFESTPGDGNFQYLFSQGPASTGAALSLPNTLHLYLAEPSGELRLRFTPSDGTHWLLNTGVNLLNGQWHQIVFTFSGDDGAALYVDGGLVDSNTGVAGARYKPQANAWLGARSDLSADRFFGRATTDSGRMDLVRIHNSALAPAQVEDIFQDETPKAGINWMVF